MDEAMVRFHGRAAFIRFISRKPIGTGMKLWMVVDYLTGLILAIKVDDGQHSAEQHHGEPAGATGAAVLDMVKPWFGSHACVFTDKEYTSPALARELLNHGLYLVGTVNAKRIPDGLKSFFSKEPKTVRAGAQDGKLVVRHGKPLRGDYQIYQHKLSSASIFIILAQDTGKVLLVDTMHGHKTQVLQRRGPQGELLKIRGPAAWAAHNAYKGGVDQSDQVRCNRANGRAMLGRTRRWPLRLCQGGVLDVATTNTYNMLKFINKQQGRPAVDMDAVLAAVEQGLMAKALELDALSMEGKKLRPVARTGTWGEIAALDILERFDSWLEAHKLEPIGGHRHTLAGDDPLRGERATCGYLGCLYRSRTQVSQTTHKKYYVSRHVTEWCPRCRVPLNLECFFKFHKERFMEEMAN